MCSSSITSPIPIPYIKRPITITANLGAIAVTSAPTRYHKADKINSLLLPTSKNIIKIHKDKDIECKIQTRKYWFMKERYKPKKSAILKANIDPIRAPYNEPLVCKDRNQ